MLKRYSTVLVLIAFIIFSTVIFRKYVFSGFIPFPSNLLVSFYSPWKYEVWDGYPNGPANKPIGFDVLKLFYPYRTYTTDRLKAGELPLWNPYVFSGNIHLATYQSAVFYPLNVLYFLLPAIDAWAILIMLQLILAGYFTYLFIKSLGLSVRSAFFGSVVFALSGWMLAWSQESLVIEHSALWLPLVLYGIQNFFLKRDRFGFLITTVGLTCSILAGFLQMTMYIGFFSFGFILFKYFQDKKKDKYPLFYFVFACLTAVFISAVHLLPAIVAYFGSPRGVVAAPFLFDIYLMKPWHLITFIAPDFWGNPGSYSYFGGAGFYHEKVIFIGIPAFLLSAYVLFKKINEKTFLSYFKWAGIATLLLGFVPVGWLLYYSNLPIISAMVPSRIFFLTAFSLSIVASFSIEKLLKKEWDTDLMQKILVIVATFIGLLWIFVLVMKFVPFVSEFDPKGYYGNTAFRNLIIPSVVFICCAMIFYSFSKWPSKKNTYYTVLLALSILTSLHFANKFLYFSERKFVFPETPVLTKVKELAGINRVWGYGNGYIEKNMGSFYGIYSPEGYDALYPQQYGELLYIQEAKGKYTTQISRTDAQIRQASEKDKLYEDPYRSRLLSLLGVRYILESKKGEGKDWLTTEDRFPAQHFNLSWEDDTFRIWEYKQALPRTFLVNDYVVEKDPEKIIDKLFEPSFDPRETIIIENELSINPCGSQGEQVATLEEYLPEKVRIKTKSPCDALLFLSDTYYPGWMATVDSENVPIMRANHALRSVLVPKGEHLVEFTYRPSEVVWGAYITLLSVILFYPASLFVKRHA